ncbi:sulfotransferase domain-containing protein [Catellatospora sp. KI3]|uniref:sulfotransferase domain-containing protein n=1 Tax=Catellatospora sp. KI3 TaxID=3041620 RepID=UPI002482AC79|nr:sulfotransferase domain-containing protein [Catellatospora sp. KI3]MDI1463245.1 sulfotransferase domain-containing protein [Catellatospora sp. KI3]
MSMHWSPAATALPAPGAAERSKGVGHVLLVYSGRHKAASSWSRGILREAAGLLGLNMVTVIAPEQWAPYGSLAELVRQERVDLLSLTNIQQRHYETLPPRRTVNVIRDPRDIVVSGYFSHRNTHAVQALGVTWHELIEHRERLLKLDESAGMLEEIEFSGYFLDHMDTWDYRQPEVLELRMEEQIADPVAVWTRIFEHYGLLVPPGAIGGWVRAAALRWRLGAVRAEPGRARVRRALAGPAPRRLPRAYVPLATDYHTFTRLSYSDRRPGEVDEMNHYRKGVPGDWRNYFTERHRAAFRARYGDLAERLGYPAG